VSNSPFVKRLHFPSAFSTLRKQHLPMNCLVSNRLSCPGYVPHSTGSPTKALVTKSTVLICSRTVRRLFWYLLSAIFCVWSVMILKHLDLESSKFFGLLLLSVSIPCDTWSFSQHLQLVHPGLIKSAFTICGYACANSHTVTWSSGGHCQLC